MKNKILLYYICHQSDPEEFTLKVLQPEPAPVKNTLESIITVLNLHIIELTLRLKMA